MVPKRPATERKIGMAERAVTDTARHMGRSLDTTNLAERLGRFDHPQWDTLEARCLACGNQMGPTFVCKDGPVYRET